MSSAGGADRVAGSGSQIEAGVRVSGFAVEDPAGAEDRGWLAGHRASVESASWSPDGRRILTASRDGTARIWAVSESYSDYLRVGLPLTVLMMALTLAIVPRVWL